MINVSNVSVSAGQTALLSDVNLTVSEGEWLCVIGPNGAGKTTLLRAMCGLSAFDGSVTVGGSALASTRARERAGVVAYSPQDALVPPYMTVLQYVLLARVAFAGFLGLPSSEDYSIVHASLTSVDADHLSDRVLSTLSGGERRRVMVAQALAQRAPVMLLDEPATALDIGHQQQLLEMLDSLRRTSGLTLVTTAHDLTLAGQYADRLVLLDAGRVAASGSPVDVLTPELLERHYGASVSVTTSDDGRVAVTPVRQQG